MSDNKRITIIKNGPYIVKGGLPLVRKTQVVSEFGEPLTWKTEAGSQATEEEYALCRCGQSNDKPYCDGTHRKIPFDGTEYADPAPTVERQVTFPGGTRLIVKKDLSLCMNSGFCGMRATDLGRLILASDDTQARSLAIAMVERCPSGALVYHIEEGEPDIEPDLPAQVADTTEITSAGPIAGPLWVTGCIPIERSDGVPFETRNRLTLCNCGASINKPLCDGTHRQPAQLPARQRKPPAT